MRVLIEIEVVHSLPKNLKQLSLSWNKIKVLGASFTTLGKIEDLDIRKNF
jgi:hypothetical protein